MYLRISLKYFRGAILECSTEMIEDLPRNHHSSRAKVNESNVETLVDDDVLIFYIPVKDVLRPQVKHSRHQLRKGHKLQINKRK